MALSPTAKTLAECRKRGMIAEVVERWNPHSLRRKDLFGYCDILAIATDSIIAIQCTAASSHAARRTKILETDDIRGRAIAWLEAGGRIQIWSWKTWTKRRRAPEMTLFGRRYTGEYRPVTMRPSKHWLWIEDLTLEYF